MACAGLMHGQPDIQGALPGEMSAADTVAAKQLPPPPLGQSALVVKQLEGDDCITGQLVIHHGLCGRELRVESVLGPGQVLGPAGCGHLHQGVGQIIGLECHRHAYTQVQRHHKSDLIVHHLRMRKHWTCAVASGIILQQICKVSNYV